MEGCKWGDKITYDMYQKGSTICSPYLNGGTEKGFDLFLCRPNGKWVITLEVKKGYCEDEFSITTYSEHGEALDPSGKPLKKVSRSFCLHPTLDYMDVRKKIHCSLAFLPKEWIKQKLSRIRNQIKIPFRGNFKEVKKVFNRPIRRIKSMATWIDEVLNKRLWN
tara:strand:+ start:651 stop:1142 length:492 start_codon:yes stop_codon:yes gene_type:complete